MTGSANVVENKSRIIEVGVSYPPDRLNAKELQPEPVALLNVRRPKESEVIPKRYPLYDILAGSPVDNLLQQEPAVSEQISKPKERKKVPIPQFYPEPQRTWGGLEILPLE